LEVRAEGVTEDMRVRRSSGSPAASVRRATILATSQVFRDRGGWPVRGNESSTCSVAAAGRALAHAAIAVSGSSSSGVARTRPRLPWRTVHRLVDRAIAWRWTP
jgi:hypothetical protein